MENENINNELLEESEEIRPDESKAEKFSRLATGRINKVLQGIENIGKLSNRSSYEYTDEQVEKMFTALQTTLDEAKAKFKPAAKESSAKFSF